MTYPKYPFRQFFSGLVSHNFLERQVLAPSKLSYLWGPRIIATDRQAHRIYPQMIRLCSRFDSVLFTPKMSESPSYGNYSRSPQEEMDAAEVYRYELNFHHQLKARLIRTRAV